MCAQEERQNSLFFGSLGLSLLIHSLVVTVLVVLGDFHSVQESLPCLKVTLADLPEPHQLVCLSPAATTAPLEKPREAREASSQTRVPRAASARTIQPPTQPVPQKTERKEEPSVKEVATVTVLPLSPITPTEAASTPAADEGLKGLSQEGEGLPESGTGSTGGSNEATGGGSMGKGAGGFGRGNAASDYLAKVRQLIDTHRNYPHVARVRELQGTVIVQFVISLEGKVTTLRVIQSSGYKLLDEAGLRAIREASPFPKPPTELFSKDIPLELPIVFELT